MPAAALCEGAGMSAVRGTTHKLRVHSWRGSASTSDRGSTMRRRLRSRLLLGSCALALGALASAAGATPASADGCNNKGCDGPRCVAMTGFVCADEPSGQCATCRCRVCEVDAPVRVADLARVDERESLSNISREDQQYVRILSYDFRGPTKLANRTHAAFMQSIAVPPGCTVGDDVFAWAEDDSTGGLRLVFGIGMALVILAVALVFDSVWAIAMVFAALPVALAGSAAAFWIARAPFSREAAVGVILVIGLAVNQGHPHGGRHAGTQAIRKGYGRPVHRGDRAGPVGYGGDGDTHHPREPHSARRGHRHRFAVRRDRAGHGGRHRERHDRGAVHRAGTGGKGEAVEAASSSLAATPRGTRVPARPQSLSRDPAPDPASRLPSDMTKPRSTPGAERGHAESGRRDSNPRQPAWEAGALPTELLPQRPEISSRRAGLSTGGGRRRGGARPPIPGPNRRLTPSSCIARRRCLPPAPAAGSGTTGRASGPAPRPPASPPPDRSHRGTRRRASPGGA